MSVVSLTVHRNNIDARRRKVLRAELRGDVVSILRDFDLAGYALVAWDKSGSTRTRWDCGQGQPVFGGTLSVVVKRALDRQVAIRDAEDVVDERFDFEPDEGA